MRSRPSTRVGEQGPSREMGRAEARLTRVCRTATAGLVCPRVEVVQPDRPALVVYQARAPAVLATETSPDAGFQRLIGRTRAAVLHLVARPGRHTTSTIAYDVGISVSSSSEHLTALREAGLVSSQRSGSAVVHRASSLGERMCGGWTDDTRLAP
jgi:DNA-binding transcriptional ArsR family regulator